MRIYHSVEGGCHVVIDSGFIEAFNDDHPGSNLQGLTGCVVHFDVDRNVARIQFKQSDIRRWQGPHLSSLLEMAEELAKEQRPTISGVFQIGQTLTPPLPVVEKVTPAPVVRLAPSAPANTDTFRYRKVSPTVILRQKAV